MGNTSAIYRKKGIITIDEISKTLDNINKEIFNNTLPIMVNNEGISFINEDVGEYLLVVNG